MPSPALQACEEVLSAFQMARTLFPFPILGVDADNGSEFINASLFTYCEEEGLTFTRGRPDLKNDQCFMEQKNGVVVRQTVGHERFEGEGVYQQLGEVYQALRLYVNCFQPSMKLQAKLTDGKKVRRVYDAAKTPLQRLLLSPVLSAEQRELVLRMVQMLDPLGLFEHLQELQQALFASLSFEGEENAPHAHLSFCLQRCLAGSYRAGVQGVEPVWSQEMTLSDIPAPASSCKPEQEAGSSVPCAAPMACSSAGTSSEPPLEERALPVPAMGEEQTETKPPVASQAIARTGSGSLPERRRRAGRKPSRHLPSALSIEQVIGDYLADQVSRHHRPKTLEWHETALGSLQRYLLRELHAVQLCQMTPVQIEGWLTFLQEQPSTRGSLRSAGTVQSYARSAQAFCRWLVQKKYLTATPFASLSLPAVEIRSPRQLSLEEWESLLRACQPLEKMNKRTEQAAARNRALLWVLFDTGMQASEVCRLQVGDVDLEQGRLVVRGRGAKERRLTLGQQALGHLLVYLDDSRLSGVAGGNEEVLFLSQTGHPLTKNGVNLLFARLRERAGITRKGVTAALLRESFAVRYLRAGGDLDTLQELLGQQGSLSWQQAQLRWDQATDDQRAMRRSWETLSARLYRARMGFFSCWSFLAFSRLC
jgi:site-specific recombinase XerD